MLSVSVKSKLIAGVADGVPLLSSPGVLVRVLKAAHVYAKVQEKALIPFRNNQAALLLRRTPVGSDDCQ